LCSLQHHLPPIFFARSHVLYSPPKSPLLSRQEPFPDFIRYAACFPSFAGVGYLMSMCRWRPFCFLIEVFGSLSERRPATSLLPGSTCPGCGVLPKFLPRTLFGSAVSSPIFTRPGPRWATYPNPCCRPPPIPTPAIPHRGVLVAFLLPPLRPGSSGDFFFQMPVSHGSSAFSTFFVFCFGRSVRFRKKRSRGPASFPSWAVLLFFFSFRPAGLLPDVSFFLLWPCINMRPPLPPQARLFDAPLEFFNSSFLLELPLSF